MDPVTLALARRKIDALDLSLGEFQNAEVTALDGNPIPIDAIGSVLYGRNSTNPNTLMRSLDEGDTWETVQNTNVGTGSIINGLRAMSDGEVLLIKRADGVWKSSGWAADPTTATWAQVVTPTVDGAVPAWILPWGVAEFGNVVIVAEYAVAPRDASRYAWVSTNAGSTFTVARDLEALYPTLKASVHWHAVGIDRTNGRLWAVNGDGPRDAFYSDNNGSTWTAVGDENRQPTVLVSTPNGMLAASDRIPDGILRLTPDGYEMLYTLRGDAASLYGFGMHSATGPDGSVFISFTSQINGRPAYIFGSPDGRRVTEVYRLTPSGSTQPNIGNLMVMPSGRLIADVTVDGVASMLRAYTRAPGYPSVESFNAGGVLNGVADRRSLAAGDGSKATAGSVSVGPNSNGGTDRSIAVGANASATGTRATAIGYAAIANSSLSTVVGSQAAAPGTNAVAVGRLASAAARGATLGEQATTTGDRGTAVGYLARSEHSSAVALGADVTTTAALQVRAGAVHLELDEVVTDPDAPAANRARLFTRDNGAGKTQVCVRFATGAVQVLATEP